MRLENILVPLDGSEVADQALLYAAELAKTVGASLTLVRTTDTHPGLHELAYQLQTQGLVVHSAVAVGEGRHRLLSELACRQPDLIVMAVHARWGLHRLVYGSVEDAVVAHAGCPVMLVRTAAGTESAVAPRLAGKRVIVPLDGSKFSETALPLALDLARGLGSDVVLVQAVVPVYHVPTDLVLTAAPSLDEAVSLVDAQDAATEYLNSIAERGSASAHLRVTGLARVGYLTDVIRELNAAAPASMVVMATHHRSGLARALLGEEADSVLRHDHVPVVLVRPRPAEPEEVTDEASVTVAGRQC
jgi:nucleotide-binding universal stress UspA family protein